MSQGFADAAQGLQRSGYYPAVALAHGANSAHVAEQQPPYMYSPLNPQQQRYAIAVQQSRSSARQANGDTDISVNYPPVTQRYMYAPSITTPYVYDAETAPHVNRADRKSVV